MVLDTLAKFEQAFYRLTGSKADADSLIEQGEAAGDVALLWLTHGCWAAQQILLDAGLAGWWRKRSAAIVWLGSDATTGGRYWALPTDFLRLSGDRGRSSLVQANGDTWGRECDEKDDPVRGNAYYLRNAQLWLLRGAGPPATLYLDYVYRHAEWDSGIGGIAPAAQFDFPTDLRPLIVVCAAQQAWAESWIDLSDDQKHKTDDAVTYWTRQAQKIARRSRAARRMRVGPRYPGYLTGG